MATVRFDVDEHGGENMATVRFDVDEHDAENMATVRSDVDEHVGEKMANVRLNVDERVDENMATVKLQLDVDERAEDGETSCVQYPPGFEALLECLTTEILFQQPFNVYRFAAEYIDGLLDIRDVTGKNPLDFLSSAIPDQRQLVVTSLSRTRDTPLSPYAFTAETFTPSPRLLLDSKMTEMSYESDTESAYTEPSNFSRELSPETVVIPGIPGVFYNYMLRKGSFFQDIGERSESLTKGCEEDGVAKIEDLHKENEQEVAVTKRKAATTIQRLFRGYLARKKVKAKRLSHVMLSAHADFDACQYHRCSSRPEIYQRDKEDEKKRELLWRQKIRDQVHSERMQIAMQEQQHQRFLTNLMVMS